MYLRLFLMICMMLCGLINARYANRTNATNPFAPYRNNQARVQGARGGLAQIDPTTFGKWRSPERTNYTEDWMREGNWSTRNTNWNDNWNKKWNNKKSNKSSGYSYEQDEQDDLPSFWRRSRGRSRRLSRFNDNDED